MRRHLPSFIHVPAFASLLALGCPGESMQVGTIAEGSSSSSDADASDDGSTSVLDGNSSAPDADDGGETEALDCEPPNGDPLSFTVIVDDTGDDAPFVDGVRDYACEVTAAGFTLACTRDAAIDTTIELQFAVAPLAVGDTVEVTVARQPQGNGGFGQVVTVRDEAGVLRVAGVQADTIFDGSHWQPELTIVPQASSCATQPDPECVGGTRQRISVEVSDDTLTVTLADHSTAIVNQLDVHVAAALEHGEPCPDGPQSTFDIGVAILP